ncbi:MAG: hypothetical protein BIFFINMI_02156 [Phycisphaerae bacterium]|nr:hypothetical protein [Phycisphaerae bacterium]
MAKRKTLADRLIQEIRRAERGGLTRYRLAGLSGVSESQLSRIVNGQIVPTLTTAERIVNALKLQISIGPKE